MENTEEMGIKEFIGLSACCMMLTAVGIDVMLPAFGEIRKHLNLDESSTATAYIVTSFFWGQIFQLVFGAMSDIQGRIFVLRVGFPLYILGGLLAASAGTLPLMCIGRFIAGMGASAVFMTIMASVRDRFEGDQMARVMSFVFTVFLLTPVLAPFIGFGILKISSWRVVFLFPPVFGVFVFLWSLRLKETLKPECRIQANFREQLSAFRQVIAARGFLRYTMVTTLLFGGISAYVSNVAYLINDLYGKPELFSWIFAAVGLVMALGAFTNGSMSKKLGARKCIKWLVISYFIISLLLLAANLLNRPIPNLYSFFIGIALLLGLNLAIEPNSSALAMANTGKNAGVASAVYGTSFFFAGATIGTLIGYFLSLDILAFSIGFSVIGTLVLYIVIQDKQP